ncbi:MAG TPA: c-type cytochrome [Polyangiaceae bacterium]|nr:c-type cytochrome [Polyangiaceae bacterium]
MFRKILTVLAGLLLLLVIAATATFAYTSHVWDSPVPAPLPPISADGSPAALERGAALFHSTCEVCHRGPGSATASGAPVTDVPAFLGTFHAPNLTRHPQAVLASYSDAELARLIRYGIDRNEHHLLMPTYGMGDADVAALLGFLRSADPLFHPDARPSPRSELSTLGRAVLVLAGAADTPERPAQGIPVPEKRASKEYGRYLATQVFDCVGCHSPGFGPQDPEAEDAFIGGFEFQDPSGAPIVSRNLTPHPTGLAHYSPSDLDRALRSGLRPDGSALSPPMPLFRGLEEIEVAALYTYLQSLPARAAAEGGATSRRPSPPSHERPEARFASLGCGACHGPGAHHASALAHVSEKTPEELARWIRHPERTLPGTPMPSYAAVLDEAAALELATWIRDGAARNGRLRDGTVRNSGSVD